MYKYQYIKLLLPLGLLSLSACSAKVDNRGYVSDAQWKENITIGTTTKDQVFDVFGSPSSQSTFGEETWYYVSSRKEGTAFLKPEIVEQNVTRLTFDANGVVSGTENFDKNSGKDFELAKRITPTEGHQLSFVEQILGNIGRFNKGGDSGAAPGRKPGGY